MYDMSSTRSGGAPEEECDRGFWTTETLPLAVRKELLERELNQLGFRKAGQGGSARAGANAQQQQQPQRTGGDDEHPRADPRGDDHGD
jgi:hypothetical protein